MAEHISYPGSNIRVDPQFCDEFANNFRLEAISPCIDAGLDLLVTADNSDVDEDGVIQPKIPWDRGRNGVRQFDSISGNEWVDMGAFEYLHAQDCPYDLNGDFSVDIEDLAILLSCFGGPAAGSCTAADYNCDGDVDIEDLALLLSNFGTNCGGSGFAGGEGYSALEQWIMSATIPEILAWWYAGMPPMDGSDR